MIAANPFTDLINNITGCRCGTEVFAMSLGLFAFSLILIIWALYTLRQAKAIRNTNLQHAQKPELPQVKRPAATVKAIEKKTEKPSPQSKSPSGDGPLESHTETVGLQVDPTENDMTEINAISPLPNLEMLPYPDESMDENDATVLMKRQKPKEEE